MLVKRLEFFSSHTCLCEQKRLGSKVGVNAVFWVLPKEAE
jgi:hypothetical protein